MKKYSRSLALLLALLVIFSAAACAGSNVPEETTLPETSDSAATVTESDAEPTSTTAPETTEDYIEETTRDTEVSTAISPETTEEITAPPETEPPKATDTVRIIMQNGRGEAILSGLIEEKYKTLLKEREDALVRDFGLGEFGGGVVSAHI